MITEGFKRTARDKISRIKVTTQNALEMFIKALHDLEDANDDLLKIIESETKKIEVHGNNIYNAEMDIIKNNKVINNIRNLINEG